MRGIIVIAHNLRSCHNVGSLLRTAEGLAIEKCYLTGYTPYSLADNDTRMPHIANKINGRIRKSALGAELFVDWEHVADICQVIGWLRKDGYRIVALEQTEKAVNLPDYRPPDRLAIIVGREVEGMEPEVLELVDESLYIPMLGRKESFNVVQAAAMALYHCRFSEN